MEVSKYNSEYEEAILSAIREDPNWNIFTNNEAIDDYKLSLKDSVTYVCIHKSEFCGYVRAILDSGFGIYISELFVEPKWRNKKIGRSLLEQVKKDYSDIAIYALSDEDAYYEKIGYKKIGSVFQL